MDGCRIVAVTLNVIVDLCQRATKNRPDQLRKNRAHSSHLSSSPSLGDGWYFDANVPIPWSCCGDTVTFFLFLFALACDLISSCCVAWACLSASAALTSVASIRSLNSVMPAMTCCMSLTFQHLPALSTALGSTSDHATPVPLTEALPPSLSFNNSCAVDRVKYHFQTRIEWKIAVKCTQVNSRVVAKNRVHALNHGATGIRFTMNVCEIFRSAWKEFADNLEDTEMPAHISQDSNSELRKKLVPNSRKHSIFTHFPKDRNCEVCLRTKMTRHSCRRRNSEAARRAEKFGDLVTADQKLLNEEGASRSNHRYAVMMQDLATDWIQSYLCKTKILQGTKKNARTVTKTKSYVHSDNSLEFGESCGELSWNHRTSTPHRSETHGVAERAVRRVKERTSGSCHNQDWMNSGGLILWNAAVICETCKSSWRMGKFPLKTLQRSFKGPILPFGAMVNYFPTSIRDQSWPLQFEKKVLPGIFLEYALIAEKNVGRRLMADLEDLETMDASEVHPRRINAKKIIW